MAKTVRTAHFARSDTMLRALAMFAGAVTIMMLAASTAPGAAIEAPDRAAPVAHAERQMQAMMNAPSVVRQCLSDVPGLLCHARLPAAAAPAMRASVASLAQAGSGRTTLIAVLLGAFAAALGLVVVFWRELARTATAPEDFRRQPPQNSVRRRRGMSA